MTSLMTNLLFLFPVILLYLMLYLHLYYITFSHVADTFIQSDLHLQTRTTEAIKINKSAMICNFKCYDKSRLA